MEGQVKEKPLTLKGLQKHLILTVVSAICLAVLGGILTSFVFYHKANNNFEVLHQNDIEHDSQIQSINTTLQDINNKLGTTNTTTAVSDEKIKGLENTVNDIKDDVGNIQKNQTEILKILGDIKRKQ
jgi:peptidoglycan hydrolase CwlO-like protein